MIGSLCSTCLYCNVNTTLPNISSNSMIMQEFSAVLLLINLDKNVLKIRPHNFTFIKIVLHIPKTVGRYSSQIYIIFGKATFLLIKSINQPLLVLHFQLILLQPEFWKTTEMPPIPVIQLIFISVIKILLE